MSAAAVPIMILKDWKGEGFADSKALRAGL